MTETERLCELLDERGAEHTDAEDGHTQHTWWSDGDHEIAACNSGERLAVYNLTPEQAVEATLGRGECHDSNNRFNAWQCSECGATMLLMFDDCGEPTYSVGGVADVPRYCPNCGRKVVEE